MIHPAQTFRFLVWLVELSWNGLLWIWRMIKGEDKDNLP